MLKFLAKNIFGIEIIHSLLDCAQGSHIFGYKLLEANLLINKSKACNCKYCYECGTPDIEIVEYEKLRNIRDPTFIYINIFLTAKIKFEKLYKRLDQSFKDKKAEVYSLRCRFCDHAYDFEIVEK